jgi:cholesterol transport system auxiliary component
MKRVLLRCLAWIAVLAAAGCATPDKPVRATLYDFGPGVAVQAAGGAPAVLAPLVLTPVESSGALDGSAVLYRLGYSDAHQLRPYANARWSAPPTQLIRQRLREKLASERAVLDFNNSSGLARTAGAMPRILRLELEEFSHYFEAPTQSGGLLRLRATLMENTLAGERLLAQRSVEVRRPAANVEAAGGVRALAAATDAAAEEIRQWLRQQP